MTDFVAGRGGLIGRRLSALRAPLLVLTFVCWGAPAGAQQPPDSGDGAAEGGQAAEPVADAPATRADPRFAPPANLNKNPIDLLPSDVVYPPLGDRRPNLVYWSPEWPRFSTADWIVTGAAAAITIGAAIVPPRPAHAYGGVLLDEDARSALRLPTTEGRYMARDASDVLVSLEATWPFFVDALITTWWYRASPDAAAQMALVNAEALTVTTAIQGMTNTAASRERPYGRICGTPEQPGATLDCEGNVRYRSFFSGHTAFSFMSASLICVHHMKLALWGGVGDVVSCVAGYTGAAATGALRIMGDMHYLSDVVVGAGVGTLVGLAVPLWHYRRVNLAPQDQTGIKVHVVPVGAGIGLGGTF